MKRSILVFVVAGLVLITSALWFFSSNRGWSLMDISQFLIIFLIVVFALYFGYKRISSEKRGEPVEDELTKKVMRKTASFSYFISLYLWLALMYFSDKINYESHTIIGVGILGMAVIFAICWLVFNFTGVRNE